MSDVVVERLPPEEAFELVAHELRLRTLRVLNDADGPLSFSELRERVGTVDSGQFNYHLDKIRGQFVRKVGDENGEADGAESGDGPEGYELTAAGKKVVGGVLSGGYTREFDADPVPMDATCVDCDAPMELRFAGDRVVVQCTDCGARYTSVDMPPAVLDGLPREAAPGAVADWLHTIRTTFDNGLCYNCNGRVERSVFTGDEAAALDWMAEAEGTLWVREQCGRCGRLWHSLPELSALNHPAVVAFHWEHGIDLRETPGWELPWVAVGLAEVRERDPLRAVLPITLDRETREFVFDGNLELVDERPG
jgi:hypothetical protein